MARMTGFVFQDKYLDRLSKLSDEELGRLVRALSIYHATGEEQELDGRECGYYEFIKGDIDEIEQAYQNKCKNMKRQQPTAIDRNCTQLPATADNINKKENKENTTLTGSTKEKRSRFSVPTVDEVAKYCKERGNKVDAQRFVDFYAAKGWKVGQTPMKDWKACVRTWEQRDSGQTAQKPRILRAQDYQQRDYTEGALADALGVDALFREAAG